jgi:hypothetical protein
MRREEVISLHPGMGMMIGIEEGGIEGMMRVRRVRR